MERVEDKIRKYLAKHLDVISNDLELIKEEFYLKNSNGADGKIDILAKDQDNNYVVIEIKKSDQAARQGLHEIAKYTALLKQELFVKDSEIRIIIISTTWHELLVPFSETQKYSLHYLEGYKITLDTNDIPIVAEKVTPIDIENEREFSRIQSFFLYRNNKQIKKNKENLQKYALVSGFSDFLILEIHTDDEIPYPVALYFAYQKMNEGFYLSILSDMKIKSNNECCHYDEACELKEDPDVSEDEYMNFLEQMITVDVINSMECDDYEIGYPEKIEQALSKSWKIDKVHRYGIFERDKRLPDYELVGELCGINGGSLIYYYNQCLSKYKAKVIEIKEAVKNSLYLNQEWEEEIDTIFGELINDKRDFRINVSIFNPEDIFGTIACIPFSNFADCVPQYQVVVEYFNENIIKTFYGIINWEREGVKFNQIINKYFYRNDFNYFTARQLHSIHEIDSKIMNDMGLKYSTELLVIKDGQRNYYDLHFKRNRIELIEVTDKKHLDDYLISNPDIMNDIVMLYKKYVCGYPDNFK